MSKPDTMFSAKLKIYDALVAGQSGLERKGKANPYTSMNGNMFSFLARDGTICIRLSADDRKAFSEICDMPPVEQYGSVMKDYVALPETLVADAERLAAWFELSVQHARGLKPKPTK